MRKVKKRAILVVMALILQLFNIMPATAVFIEPLEIPITLRDCVGTGIKDYPVSVIIPIAEGTYYDTYPFALYDSDGNIMPAEFEVMTKWWASGGSIRHLKVNFAPNEKNVSKDIYYLRNDFGEVTNENTLNITENDNYIQVNTGVMKFTVNKVNFSIIEDVYVDINKDGNYTSEECIIPAGNSGGEFVGRLEGDIQLDKERNDVVYEIENQGSVSAVIKATAPTIFTSTEDHLHGFAVRIYAYAGKPYVKIDYQLQNSAKNVRYSWPLYFENMGLGFNTNLDEDVRIRTGISSGLINEINDSEDKVYIAQKSHNQVSVYDGEETINDTIINNFNVPNIGFLNVEDENKGMTTFVRHFWEMWPNEISYEQNKLKFELFPEWSSQWQQGGGLSSTGLYWLEDMQQVYKSCMLYFHEANVDDSKLLDMAKNFEYPAVGILPTSSYKEAEATLGYGGVIPYENISDGTKLLPTYVSGKFNQTKYYGFNWRNFGDPDSIYRAKSITTGGWPYGIGNVIATGNPADYFVAEQYGIGELNVRPQWLPGYNYTNDNEFLKLTENPYGGGTWRSFEGHGKLQTAAPYLEGTEKLYYARDDEHGWSYHVEEAYQLTGNPWIKDWYEFISEFRKVRLNKKDPWPDNCSRAQGHSINQAIEAYNVTGDEELLTLLKKYIKDVLLQEQQDPTTGILKTKIRN